MWSYPEIDPILIRIGPIAIHWYAISYLVGISLAWWVLSRRARDERIPWNSEQLSDLLFYSVLGIVIGGRVGYMLFYNRAQLLADPLSLFRVWEGGMSFHGGLVGVMVAFYIFGRWHGKTFFEVADYVTPAVPLGLGCGRLGNFANTELPGRVTDVPWGVVFPGETVARHPSSLYQAILEGPVLFTVLWLFSARPRPSMAVSGLFLVGYGTLRVVSEFFRQPDQQLGFIAFGWLTMGQLLSVPMILLGCAFLIYSYTQNTR
jgi:phosphatidylglycerol:prolipoprotein diacylglycerol transferase